MKETRNENGYKSILRGTSIFGGVQIFQILVNLIRGKFVALFLGPDGMGAASMFNSASNTLTQLSSLGLNLAFAKEAAAAREDATRLDHVRHAAVMLLRLTALLGAVACALLAPTLSRISFGSADYSWQFMLLSAAVFLTVSANGKMALLQGLHKIRILSTTSLAGAVCGLVAGVPLYWLFGTRGIVPAMTVLAATSYACYSFGLRKAIPRSSNRIRIREHLPLMRGMLASGIILLAATLINTLCTYIINIFIRTHGDLADVGLFNAANSITLQYAGVVFTAMAMDYFPRLTAAAGDNSRMRLVIDRQMEIVALIAAPLSILLVGTAPLVIRLLLTSEFLPTTPLMRWLGISILLKAIAYPLGYITFAKDNRRLFFWLEAVACNALYLGLSIVFYSRFGLMGLGYAAVAEQATCVLLYLAVNYVTYGFLPNRKAVTETATGVLFGTAAFCSTIMTGSTLSYYLTACVFLICAARSAIVLRTRIRGN